MWRCQSAEARCLEPISTAYKASTQWSPNIALLCPGANSNGRSSFSSVQRWRRCTSIFSCWGYHSSASGVWHRECFLRGCVCYWMYVGSNPSAGTSPKNSMCWINVWTLKVGPSMVVPNQSSIDIDTILFFTSSWQVSKSKAQTWYIIKGSESQNFQIHGAMFMASSQELPVSQLSEQGGYQADWAYTYPLVEQ